jgi:hypothetical protein
VSEGGRIVGTFWEPKPVFEDLAQRPRWWVPLILLTLLSICYVFAFSHLIGWSTFIQHEIQSNPRLQQLPLEQQARIIEQQARLGPIMGYVGAAIGLPLSVLVVAGVLLGIFRSLGGADLTFRQVFSVTCYSYLPSGLASVLSMVAMRFTNPADFDIRNPLALNLGWFLDPETTAKWLHSAAASLDLFSLWTLLLIAGGLAVAARKMRFSKSLALVVSAWIVWVAVKSGWAAAFS